ncbi:MAG TPA: FAD-dependent oxidoreductase [Polyangiales bacterium]|nr:FAD-dependent oxidoreductase [Polyangiales bacterium]
MDDTGRTVVVAGGGYSGVLAANRLRGKLDRRDRVLLVSQGDGLTQRVRLHERAVHGTDVNVPYARLLARGVEHVRGRVLGVDAGRSTLDVESQPLHYDALVLTLGSELRSRIPGASPLAYALCDEAHALQLSAALPRIPDGARVLVVGGGLTAIELASEIAEQYPRLRVEMLAARFADGLTQGSPLPRRALLEELEQLGVNVREGVRVRALEEHAAVLEDGTRLECAVAVLASGFSASPLSASFELPRRPDGRIEVDAQLRVAGVPNVFVAGDLAAPPSASVGHGLATTRMSCAAAMPMGAHAADQVVRLLSNQALAPYSFKYAAQCVSIGRRRAVALFVDADDRPTGRLVRGRRAALIKEGICRMVVGALRLERWLPGLYTWPRGPMPVKLIASAAEQIRP